MEGSSFNFDTIAKYYDAWYDDPVGKAYDIQEKNAMAKLLPQASPGAALLEVGSGTGHWSAWFSERGYRVTGIDISPEMTNRAMSRGIPGSRFMVGDFLETPIAESFAVVAAVTSLEFIPDFTAAIGKMRSLLQPGGTLIVGVLNRRSWLGLARKIKGAKDPVFSSAHFFTTGEVRKLLGPYGKPRVIGSTFALPWRAMLPAAGALEIIGSSVCPCLGNFIAGSVTV